jgi:hypothetical protein
MTGRIVRHANTPSWRNGRIVVTGTMDTLSELRLASTHAGLHEPDAGYARGWPLENG